MMTIKEAKELIASICRPARDVTIAASLKAMSAPCVIGNRVFATDGRICAAITTEDSAATAENDAAFPHASIDRFCTTGTVVASGYFNPAQLGHVTDRYETSLREWRAVERVERETAIEDAQPCPHCGKFVAAYAGTFFDANNVPDVLDRDFDSFHVDVHDIDAKHLLRLNFYYVKRAREIVYSPYEHTRAEIVTDAAGKKTMLRLTTSSRVACIMPLRPGPYLTAANASLALEGGHP